MSSSPTPPARSFAVSGIGYMIFLSRWLQAPLYLGLIVAQLIYVWVFIQELWHLGDEVINHSADVTEASVMLAVLGLIDVVMIANLLIMVIIGGYETFVSKINLTDHPDQPEWLSHVNANVLKVKLAMAIIGISSIHLLKTFIEVGNMTDAGSGSDVTGESYTPLGVFWQVVIHMVFILSAVALAAIDRMSRHVAPPAPVMAEVATGGAAPHGSREYVLADPRVEHDTIARAASERDTARI
ncbi:TIGR00645 family protein [Mycetocola sp. 2940]|uniref:TIGR00645 family protein n=1 Tax=Mycetocola sp. 2940 TaxID=3156452 RepID=UPI00339373AF